MSTIDSITKAIEQTGVRVNLTDETWEAVVPERPMLDEHGKQVKNSVGEDVIIGGATHSGTRGGLLGAQDAYRAVVGALPKEYEEA